ncbi:hypothetical protein JHK82_019051 [Glycine max]|nr:hypothetical protein JHK85_019492 [Glycine max]KAG5143356.1 hypothetical protein JHK82_019051 [Glycine max]
MEFCPSGDLHALRQRQPGKYFSEHAVSCMLFNIDGHQVPQHIMMEVGDTYKRILAEVRSLLHMASVASFNHESGCGYLKQESNGFLVRYLDSKSEG